MREPDKVQIARRATMRLTPRLLAAERSLQRNAAEDRDRRDRIGFPFRVEFYTRPTRQQRRLLKLLGLTVPPSVKWAAEALNIAGYRQSGIPRDWSLKRVQYASDSELLEAAREKD